MTTVVPAVAVGAALLLSGCVSARDVQSQSAGGTVSTPAVDPATVCPPLTGESLSRIMASPFQPNAAVASHQVDQTECRWAATDGQGFVITKTYRKEPATQFRQSFDSAQRNLGITQEIEVKGAEAAFAVPNVGRFGLLTADAYIEVNTVFPQASAEQVLKILAATAR